MREKIKLYTGEELGGRILSNICLKIFSIHPHHGMKSCPIIYIMILEHIFDLKKAVKILVKH